jgi:hypothetical protein
MFTELQAAVDKHSLEQLIELEQTIMSGRDSHHQPIPAKDVLS